MPINDRQIEGGPWNRIEKVEFEIADKVLVQKNTELDMSLQRATNEYQPYCREYKMNAYKNKALKKLKSKKKEILGCMVLNA